MILIPAIDLKDGQCVRLRQGHEDEVTVFSSSPLDTAAHWIDCGTSRLHIIDLDGAFRGSPQHLDTIQCITVKYPQCTVQVGGGIRDEDSVMQYLDNGAQYVIIGTRAARQPDFVTGLCQKYPGNIIAGLDYVGDKLAVDGWKTTVPISLMSLAQKFDEAGVSGFLHTDVTRDGMMGGPNLQNSAKLAAQVDARVIVAGGFSSMADIQELAAKRNKDIYGAVLGRALYEKTIDFRQATACLAAPTN